MEQVQEELRRERELLRSTETVAEAEWLRRVAAERANAALQRDVERAQLDADELWSALEAFRAEGAGVAEQLRVQMEAAVREAAERERAHGAAMARVDEEVERLAEEAEAAAEREELAAQLIDRLKDHNALLARQLAAMAKRAGAGGGARAGAESGTEAEEDNFAFEASGKAARGGQGGEGSGEGESEGESVGESGDAESVSQSYEEGEASPLLQAQTRRQGAGLNNFETGSMAGSSITGSSITGSSVLGSTIRQRTGWIGPGEGAGRMGADNRAVGGNERTGGAYGLAGEGESPSGLAGTSPTLSFTPPPQHSPLHHQYPYQQQPSRMAGGDEEDEEGEEDELGEEGAEEEEEEGLATDSEFSFSVPVPRSGAWRAAKEIASLYYTAGGAGDEDLEREEEEAEFALLQEENELLAEEVARLQEQEAVRGGEEEGKSDEEEELKEEGDEIAEMKGRKQRGSMKGRGRGERGESCASSTTDRSDSHLLLSGATPIASSGALQVRAAVGLKELQASRDALRIAMRGVRERAALAAEAQQRVAGSQGRRGKVGRKAEAGAVGEMLAEVEEEVVEGQSLVERAERIVARMAALESKGAGVGKKMEGKRKRLAELEARLGLAPRRVADLLGAIQAPAPAFSSASQRIDSAPPQHLPADPASATPAEGSDGARTAPLAACESGDEEDDPILARREADLAPDRARSAPDEDPIPSDADGGGEAASAVNGGRKHQLYHLTPAPLPWIGNFSRLQQLHTLLPYVPISNPKLSPAIYESVLVEMLVSPHSSYHRQLPPTLARWPPALYNLGAVIAAAEKRLLQHGSAIQLQLLAGLYVRNRDFIEALDVYLRILVAQHRAHHTDLNASTRLTESNGLTDSNGHTASHAQAPAAADMDGDSQGRVTSHADVDGEQLHSPVKSPVNGKIAGKDAAGRETAHKESIHTRADSPFSEDHRRYPAQESTVSSPNESLTSAKWPGPDVFEFIREHRLVRHLLSPAPDHHHRLPSLFLIHPRRAAALLADHIAVAPPETVVRQLLGVDSPAEITVARQLSPRGSAVELVDGAVNGTGDGEGSEVVLTGRERRMALHCYLREVFERMPEVASAFHPMQVELYADFDRRLLLPFLQSSDHYPLQDALNLCVQRGLVEEQVFLLTRMGDYKEALSLLLDRLKDMNRAIILAREVKEQYVWNFLLKRSATNPRLVAALMEQATDIFSPNQLLAGVAPNTHLKELRQHLLAVLAASATEVSLRQGCIALLQSECIDLLCLFILQSQFAARFSSTSAAPRHLPLLPLPSSTATATSTLLSPYTSSQATSGLFCGGVAGTSLLSLYSRKPFRRKAFIGETAGRGIEGDGSDLVGRAGQEEGKKGSGEREEMERRRKEKEEARAVALAFRQLEMGEAGDHGRIKERGGVERAVRRGGGGGRLNGLQGAVGSDSFLPSISQVEDEEEDEDEDEERESDGEEEEDEVLWSEQWSSAPLFPASGGLKIATIAVEAGEGYRGDSRTGSSQVDGGKGGMGERGRGGLLRAWSEVFEGERGGIVGSKDGLRRAGSEVPRGKEEGMGEFDAQRGEVVRLEGRQEVQGNKLKRREVEKQELLGGGPPRCCLCLDALHLHQQEIACFFCMHAYHVPCLEVALKLGGRESDGEMGGAKVEGKNARLTEKPMDSTEKAGTRAPLDKDFDLDDLEVKLAELEAELLEINANAEKLLRSRNELNELQLVLEKVDAAVHQREFEEASLGREITSDTALLLEQEMVSEPGKQMRLGFVTGLVPKVKAATFERILFRATRGNMYLKQEELDEPVVDPATGEEVEKVVFVVFFAGERARTKIMKICEAFGANRYPFPEDPQKQRQMHSEVIARLSELQTTIDAGNRHRDSLLNNISYQIENWASLVRREKAIYHILNQLSIDVTRKCLLAEAWCPVYAKSEIQDALHRAVTMSKADVGTIFQTIRSGESPPTYFKTNKFTGAFQGIIDAYGMARYREANPGVFTIITFPFLFAVMFGDWGHGILMLLASLWLVKNERKLGSQKLGDIMEMVYGGRYLILLMSIFSIYTGFIYNEFFAVAFDFAIFGGSAYTCRTPDCGDAASAGLVKTGNTYLFGVDPRWKGSRTELPFLNSLKMKMSIVLGVTHMFLGLALSLCNALFFDLPLNIWYEFIPQVLFLASLFGYLSLLIIVKWVTASQADLYHVMIYMFLNPTEPLGENELFWGQGTLQIVLLLIALISVPWMLFPKPLILRAEHIKKRQGRAYAALNSDNELYEMEALHPGEEGQLHHHQHEEEFDFGEVMVHQMIHTIEFVLGAVSNTASYLRLWALSLAHAELSAVFFERVLLPAFE
ncbi:unnamed protein product [Closterium sp. Naga37s-1]|nr:unnamed protein product [Closterium sp. Naga37s-1]